MSKKPVLDYTKLPDKVFLGPDTRGLFAARGVQGFPKAAVITSPFNFEPLPFAYGDDYLKQNLVPAQAQIDSLASFLTDPGNPGIYVCASEPTADKAHLFSAYLVKQFLLSRPGVSAEWRWLNRGGFEFGSTSDMLVIPDCFSDMSAARVERLRDILACNESIPRVLVVAGTDPCTFMFRTLKMQGQRLFYQASPKIHRKVEVI